MARNALRRLSAPCSPPLSPHRIAASSRRRASPVPLDRGIEIDIRRCALLERHERRTDARCLLSNLATEMIGACCGNAVAARYGGACVRSSESPAPQAPLGTSVIFPVTSETEETVKSSRAFLFRGRQRRCHFPSFPLFFYLERSELTELPFFP